MRISDWSSDVCSSDLEIWALQPRFDMRRGGRAQRLLTHPRFRAAYDFIVLRAQSGELAQELADWWTQAQIGEGLPPVTSVNEDGESSGGPRKRRRRRGGRNRHKPGDSAPADRKSTRLNSSH